MEQTLNGVETFRTLTVSIIRQYFVVVVCSRAGSTSGLFLLFQNVPPDLSICTFVLEQSLSVRALQEMLANTEEKAEGVSVKRA